MQDNRPNVSIRFSDLIVECLTREAVVRLIISFVHPDSSGEVWNIRFQITPVIDNPFI